MLPPGHPFLTVLTVNGQEAPYWSSTTFADETRFGGPVAWALFIESGEMDGRSKQAGIAARVWCVRGGNGGETQ